MSRARAMTIMVAHELRGNEAGQAAPCGRTIVLARGLPCSLS